MTEAEIVIDARGLRCPVPVIRLAQAAAEQPAGTWLRVLATDPAALADIPAWSRMRGHRVTAADQGDHTAYDVVLGPHHRTGSAATSPGRAPR